MRPTADLPTATLANDFLRLDYLTAGGPRITHLGWADGRENLLAAVPDFTIETPLGSYRFLGGHRLWHAPEAHPRSYIPDDANGLTATPQSGGVTLAAPPEPLTGIAKRLEIRLDPHRPAVLLRHELHNAGPWPVTLAPWAITQFRLGGVALMPLPTAPADSAGLLPNRLLALWPYSRLDDPRLRLHDGAALLHAAPGAPPFKLGGWNSAGWLGYWLGDHFFRKQFSPQPGQPHPDLGCNAEIYANDRFIELETLGPLVTLDPGARVAHEERWELFRTIAAAGLPADLAPLLRSLAERGSTSG